MTTETSDKAAMVAEQGAHVAPETALEEERADPSCRPFQKDPAH